MSDIGGLRKRARQGTFVPRALLRDKRLSFRARGIIAHLLDRPPGWKVRAEALAGESEHEGRDAILAALREAGACGYYRIERRRGKDGRIRAGTAISAEPVPEWAADHAEYGGKPVPVVWRDGRHWVKHKDGSLTPDGFEGFEDEDDLEPDYPGPDDDEPPAEDIDSSLFPQVTPRPENPVPVNPAPVQPVPVRPGFGPAGSGQPGFISSREEEEPKRSSSRTEPASQSQYGGLEGKSPSRPRERVRGGKRPKADRTPEQQAIFDEADKITTDWWEYLKGQNVTVMDSRQFLGCRESIVEKALTRGATAIQVKQALVACGVPFPSGPQFERALVAVQTGRGAAPPGGQPRGRPANVWVDPSVSPEERQRSFDLWDGVSVMGKRVDQQGGR